MLSGDDGGIRTEAQAIAKGAAETKAGKFPECLKCRKPIQVELHLDDKSATPKPLPCDCEADMSQKTIIVTEDCDVSQDGVSKTHFVASDKPYLVTEHAYNVLVANEWGHPVEEKDKDGNPVVAEEVVPGTELPRRDGPLTDVSQARNVTRTSPLPSPPTVNAMPERSVAPVFAPNRGDKYNTGKRK